MAKGHKDYPPSADAMLEGNCWCDKYVMPKGYPHRSTCKISPPTIPVTDIDQIHDDGLTLLDAVADSCSQMKKVDDTTFKDNREIYAIAQAGIRLVTHLIVSIARCAEASERIAKQLQEDVTGIALSDRDRALLRDYLDALNGDKE